MNLATLRIVGALVLLLAVYGWGRMDGGTAAKAECQADKLAAVEAATKRAAALQRKLDTLPKAEEPIREVVRQNPAKCERPAPVAKRLRDAIREANTAGAVPADS